MEQSTTHATETDTTVVYKHSLRPDWGLAVPVWQREDKQAFQFEDGNVRIFKRGYLDLLTTVDVAADKAARTLARLGASSDTGKAASTAIAGGGLPFGAQLLLFAELYPKGFAGVKWRKQKRGFDAPRRLKRHRNPALADASELFLPGALESMLRDGKHEEAFDAFLALMKTTDLATPTVTKKLSSLKPQAQKRLIYGLAGVLDGEEVFAIRFERWITELEAVTGKTPTWSVATIPLALARPSDWVCVRKASFARQAKWMAPRLASETAVTAKNYERWNAMAHAVASELKEAGLAARDLLDVYDFIVETLAPKKMERARVLYAEAARESDEPAAIMLEDAAGA